MPPRALRQVLPAFSRARYTPDRQTDYCTNCDTLPGTPGLHILTVADAADHLDLIVETTARDLHCPACGTREGGHGRTTVELVDAPCFEFPVILNRRKRHIACPDRRCPVSTSSESDEIVDAVAPPRYRLTCRTVFWAIQRVRRDHASVNARARQWGMNWHTVRGPKETTGMVDFTRDDQGKLPTRLLDLVPGWSGPVHARWFDERGPGFAAAVEVAALDPFQGYRNAIDEKHPGTEVVADHFRLVKLAMDCIDCVRRRVRRTLTGGRQRGFFHRPSLPLRGLP